jgi:hypothetical protein
MLITKLAALVARVTSAVLDYVIELVCLYCGHAIAVEETERIRDEGGLLHVGCYFQGGYDDVEDDGSDAYYDRIMDR